MAYERWEEKMELTLISDEITPEKILMLAQLVKSSLPVVNIQEINMMVRQAVQQATQDAMAALPNNQPVPFNMPESITSRSTNGTKR